MSLNLVNIIAFFFKYAGITFFFREVVFRNRVIILLYHEIGSDTFKEHLEVIFKHYNVIELREYVKSIKSGDFSNIPPKAIVITFDDGLKDNYKLLETVREYGCPITLFVPTSLINTNRHLWVGELSKLYNVEHLLSLSSRELETLFNKHNFSYQKKYESRQFLNENELNEMMENFDLQPHTKYHENLNCLDKKETLLTIQDSKNYLEREYNSEVHSFAPPFGLYSDKDLHISKVILGIDAFLTLSPYPNKREKGFFKLGRIGIPNGLNKNNLLLRLSGIYSYLRSLPIIRESASFYKVLDNEES